MSVASEINRIKANIADAYDEAEAKGATMPATENSANLAQTIASISAGGGDSQFTELVQRTITTVSDANVTSIGLYAFYGCGSLTSVNFPSATSIGIYAFSYCTNLSTLILRKRATLVSVNAIPSQTIVYVENADLDWYSTATNWSTIYADGRIKSIDELSE